MKEKYAELVQFYRDNENDTQLAKAINEYQKFSQIMHDIEFCLSFNKDTLNFRVKDSLDS